MQNLEKLLQNSQNQVLRAAIAYHIYNNEIRK